MDAFKGHVAPFMEIIIRSEVGMGKGDMISKLAMVKI